LNFGLKLDLTEGLVDWSTGQVFIGRYRFGYEIYPKPCDWNLTDRDRKVEMLTGEANSGDVAALEVVAGVIPVGCDGEGVADGVQG
jgi:hypothetical protein